MLTGAEPGASAESRGRDPCLEWQQPDTPAVWRATPSAARLAASCSQMRRDTAGAGGLGGAPAPASDHRAGWRFRTPSRRRWAAGLSPAHRRLPPNNHQWSECGHIVRRRGVDLRGSVVCQSDLRLRPPRSCSAARSGSSQVGSTHRSGRFRLLAAHRASWCPGMARTSLTRTAAGMWTWSARGGR